jgi:hypothetical protein
LGVNLSSSHLIDGRCSADRSWVDGSNVRFDRERERAASRGRRGAGGGAFDVRFGPIAASGLSMPHPSHMHGGLALTADTALVDLLATFVVLDSRNRIVFLW